ncbi:MAG TPA: winged helix DNA-binding domain-containing protein [Anaerolineales bacterium]|nr:winged helix DNA-binding domain-containing protein [Anaerolineales bacterium]
MDIARQRLHNLRLSGRPFVASAEAVHWLLAVQSQDFAPALWSIGLRLQPTTEAHLLRDFDAGAFLRTHVLRPTWHFVAPEDIRWLLALTAPRVHGVNGTIYRQQDLSAALLGRCQTLFARALKGGRHLTREELGEALARAGVADPTHQRLAYMVMAAELDGVICSGPRAGKQFTYALLEERVAPAPNRSRHDALAELARRYFAGRGPASVQDFARWSSLTLSDAQAGLEAARNGLIAVSSDGQELWAQPTETSLEPAPPALLLSVFDEYVAGYRDRRAICPPRYWKVLEGLGNALHHILVIDGQIVGTWRRTLTKTAVEIELAPLRRLSAGEKRAVKAEAERFGGFLGLPVEIE